MLPVLQNHMAVVVRQHPCNFGRERRKPVQRQPGAFVARKRPRHALGRPGDLRKGKTCLVAGESLDRFHRRIFDGGEFKFHLLTGESRCNLRREFRQLAKPHGIALRLQVLDLLNS